MFIIAGMPPPADRRSREAAFGILLHTRGEDHGCHPSRGTAQITLSLYSGLAPDGWTVAESSQIMHLRAHAVA